MYLCILYTKIIIFATRYFIAVLQTSNEIVWIKRLENKLINKSRN